MNTLPFSGSCNFIWSRTLTLDALMKFTKVRRWFPGGIELTKSKE